MSTTLQISLNIHIHYYPTSRWSYINWMWIPLNVLQFGADIWFQIVPSIFSWGQRGLEAVPADFVGGIRCCTTACLRIVGGNTSRMWWKSNLCTANVIPEPSCCEATVQLVHYPQMLTTTGNLSSGIFCRTNSM